MHLKPSLYLNVLNIKGPGNLYLYCCYDWIGRVDFCRSTLDSNLIAYESGYKVGVWKLFGILLMGLDSANLSVSKIFV